LIPHHRADDGRRCRDRRRQRFDSALAAAKIDVRATYDNALVEKALQRSK
jgi:hypothetical protein